MPRRKISVGLIPNRRLRANTFAKRKDGLKKKARELATLCGVRVAVVCAAAGGAGTADVWESAPGAVIDAYPDVPAEERAKHTHAAYADAELRNAEKKLVKVRQEGPPALAPCHAALYALPLHEAQRVLAAVDEALRAVDARRAALGMPIDDDAFGLGGDGCCLNGFLAAPGASDAVGLAAPHFAGSNQQVSIDGGYVLRAQGSNANEQQAMWDTNGFDACGAAMNWQPGYAFQQCTADMDGYNNNMYANNNGNSSIGGRVPCWDAFHPPSNAVDMYGFECAGTGNGYAVGGTPSHVAQQQVPSNAVVSLGYPALEMGLSYVDASVAQQGGNFNAALSLAMANCDSFVNALSLVNGDLVNAIDYASQWSSAGQL